MTTTPNHRESVRNGSVTGQQFGDLKSIGPGPHRTERTADFDWRLWLGIESVQLTEPTDVEDQNHRPSIPRTPALFPIDERRSNHVRQTQRRDTQSTRL